MRSHDLDDLSHRAREVGPLPVVQRFFERLGVDELLHTYVPEHRLGRQPALSNAQALTAMVANILTSREPLYAVPGWLARRVVEHAGLREDQVGLMNDDRIGRALDRLYDTDPASLMTALVVRAVKEFRIDLSQAHSDTTTVTFSGAYEGQKDKEQLQRPPLITFGYNKDHRPDLKQLVYSLTVSADGAVPVHYKLYDGNKSDDKTHIETWQAVHQIAGRPDFTYVGDSKLCTRENMGFIADQGGVFVTVLPRSRQEDDAFRAYLQDHPIPWQEVSREKDDGDEPDRVYEAFEALERSAEGYRVVWYRSSVKRALDEKHRGDRITRAKMRIENLEQRTGAHRFRTVESAQKAAEQVLQDEGAKLWLKVQICESTVQDFKQATPGRPGKDTKYRRVDIPLLLFQVEELPDAIRADARCDGLFAMVTNHASLSPKELLAVYKYQPFLEKRNEQLKSVLAVAPVFLKKPERVAALLFLYFIAVLVFALIEREARQQMDRHAIDAIPLYPEGRPCRAPTCDGILQAFEGLRRTELLDSKGTVLRTFFDPLSPVAKQLIKLLHVPGKAYGV
jgi:transposase